MNKSYEQAKQIKEWLSEGKSVCHLSGSDTDQTLRDLEVLYGGHYTHTIAIKKREGISDCYLHELRPKR